MKAFIIIALFALSAVFSSPVMQNPILKRETTDLFRQYRDHERPHIMTKKDHSNEMKIFTRMALAKKSENHVRFH